MNCRRAQLVSSSVMDGQTIGIGERRAVERHVVGCAACRGFIDGSTRVRAAVRIRPAERVPDLTGRIMAAVARGSEGPARRVRRPRPGRFLPAIAAAIAGTLVGSLLVGGPWGARSRVASASEIASAVRDAATSIAAFRGSYTINEHGLSPDVPDRLLTMELAYLAPQRFRLEVRDETSYPSRAWTPTDIDYVENMPATYLAGPTGCGAPIAADCPPTRVTETRRTPFSIAAPLPADLIAPIATFGTADGIQVVGDEPSAGHETTHVAMSFERAAPLFPFLRLGGTWRPVFSADRVDLWLDRAGWYPVRVLVSASAETLRRDWEMRFNLPHEPPGTGLLDVSLTWMSSAPPAESSFEIHGGGATSLTLEDAPGRIGYEPTTPRSTGDLRLASVVAPVGGGTSVLVYTGGLEYLRIREDRNWRGPEPFGPISLDAERVMVPGVGPALYEPATDGLDHRLAIHTVDTDLFLDTNLSREELLALSSSLGVRSEMPASWRRVRAGGIVIERAAPSATLLEAGVDVGDLPAGYVPTSAARTLTQGRTTGLTVTFRRPDTDAAGPPLTLHRGVAGAADVVETDRMRVAVGTGTGLFAPSASLLTWTDGGVTWSLQGDVGLGRLVEIAAAIRREAP